MSEDEKLRKKTWFERHPDAWKLIALGTVAGLLIAGCIGYPIKGYFDQTGSGKYNNIAMAGKNETEKEKIILSNKDGDYFTDKYDPQPDKYNRIYVLVHYGTDPDDVEDGKKLIEFFNRAEIPEKNIIELPSEEWIHPIPSHYESPFDKAMEKIYNETKNDEGRPVIYLCILGHGNPDCGEEISYQDVLKYFNKIKPTYAVIFARHCYDADAGEKWFDTNKSKPYLFVRYYTIGIYPPEDENKDGIYGWEEWIGKWPIKTKTYCEKNSFWSSNMPY
ncbi:hypothetical protein [Archaeoglobus veneficus]|uniref:Uncharacterized protein n=1 Tax=Archaeoglobus veneficus (strain DSM 11195 / SNP6) TaxID=693661 RepID=F2KMI2_ARCVS|nr:hypothetical protein [Archaeoglobus veneficus]AEA47179.1 hypothetical protein Arcve_1171 [Archaeoglobus veneficus SNP6]